MENISEPPNKNIYSTPNLEVLDLGEKVKCEIHTETNGRLIGKNVLKENGDFIDIPARSVFNYRRPDVIHGNMRIQRS